MNAEVMIVGSGLIGFVGLMVPHFLRLLIGYDHRLLIPASGLTGAIFLILADAAARTIQAIQAAVRTDPEDTVAVLVDRSHPVVTEAFRIIRVVRLRWSQ